MGPCHPVCSILRSFLEVFFLQGFWDVSWVLGPAGFGSLKTALPTAIYQITNYCCYCHVCCYHHYHSLSILLLTFSWLWLLVLCWLSVLSLFVLLVLRIYFLTVILSLIIRIIVLVVISIFSSFLLSLLLLLHANILAVCVYIYICICVYTHAWGPKPCMGPLSAPL